MSGTGDVNNDGIDDVIIAATRCHTDCRITVIGAQVVYVIFGQKGRFTDINLGSVDLSASRIGFNITGIFIRSAWTFGEGWRRCQ